MPLVTGIFDAYIFAVFHLVGYQQDLRMVLEEIIRGDMYFEISEPAAESDVVFDTKILVAEDDDLMLMKRVAHGTKIRLI